MTKKQIYNPYLPSFEYIPDGEPHVFGNRIYLYGSHDRFDGAHFCLNDYVCYSADVTDLCNWKYEGIIYKKEQDPRNQNIPADTPEAKPATGHEKIREDSLNGPGIHAMWAPDVVCGLDGRYYLYYCLDFLPEIAVAVCDTPAGKFEYIGLVSHKDGTALGTREGDLIQFDPGIFIDDDNSIYLYSGNAPMHMEHKGENQGSQVMTLEPDMLTLKEEPKMLLPNIHESIGTDYEGHAFFEASSIRKVGSTYYFVYSSVNSHELCYAISQKPDADYRYGGTLVDIGDIYLDGRTPEDSLNPLGNTHGGMEYVNGQWYIFYHRQTNRTNFSRQACAEPIFLREDGSIMQVPVTSSGLNQGPLAGNGSYPAYICCQLTGKEGTVLSHPKIMEMKYPYLTQDVGDMEPNEENMEREQIRPYQYIKNITSGSSIGYKYFDFEGNTQVDMFLRGKGNGKFNIYCDLSEAPIGEVLCDINHADFSSVSGSFRVKKGVSSLYFVYEGEGVLDFLSFTLK
ncbi:family 43 glycosylhydrolase [Lachnospiraceae bacterium OttesenSCG-928-D06]|nr:family 43 glycosylhydrolase [Lachnospiraceae bacterium OttesenSCG-928-D06]